MRWARPTSISCSSPFGDASPLDRRCPLVSSPFRREPQNETDGTEVSRGVKGTFAASLLAP